MSSGRHRLPCCRRRRRPPAAAPPPPAALVPGGQSFKRGMAEYVRPDVMPSCCMPLPLGAGQGLTARLRRWSNFLAGSAGQERFKIRRLLAQLPQLAGCPHGRCCTLTLLHNQGTRHANSSRLPASKWSAGCSPAHLRIPTPQTRASGCPHPKSPGATACTARCKGSRQEGPNPSTLERHCCCKVGRLARLLASWPSAGRWQW